MYNGIRKRTYILVAMLIIICSGCQIEEKESEKINKEHVIINDTFNKEDFIDYNSILEEAIFNLENSNDFKIKINSIVSYSTESVDGDVNEVYGENIRNFTINKDSECKAYEKSNSRYSKESPYTLQEVFYYKNNDKYYSKTIDSNGECIVNEISDIGIPPYNNDIYVSVCNYGEQADFISENKDSITYELIHPKWYELRGALGFANLGVLLAYNDSKMIEDYVLKNYPNVVAPKFIIYVDRKTHRITKIIEDDKAFMGSILSLFFEAGLYKINDENETSYEIYDYGIDETFSKP